MRAHTAILPVQGPNSRAKRIGHDCAKGLAESMEIMVVSASP